MAMKKIMFNDKLGLTQAVLEGRKTQTRRGIPELKDIDSERIRSVKVENVEDDGSSIFAVYLPNGERRLVAPKFKVGEVVAIAQSYRDIAKEYEVKSMYFSTVRLYYLYSRCPGWHNKMFVKADWMLHHIKITDIKIERLQDISVKDCLEEGIEEVTIHEDMVGDATAYRFHGSENYATAKKAYHALINKLDKQMWKQNPLVWVYEFRLVD